MHPNHPHLILALVFTTPWMLLLGLAGSMIPLLIHLLNKHNRVKTDWAAIEFIKEAWNQEKNKSRLRNYTLLALRCLIPIMMGLILSGPKTGGYTGKTSTHIYVVVDDGIVSKTTNQNGVSDIELNKSNAITVIDESTPQRIFIQRTSEPTTTPQNFNDKRSAIAFIQNIKSNNTKSDLLGAVTNVHQHIQNENIKTPHVHISSQFRKGSFGNITTTTTQLAPTHILDNPKRHHTNRTKHNH